MSIDLKSNIHQNNLKKFKSCETEVYEFEDFRLDAAHLMLYRGEEEIHLPPKQVETLLALVERGGEIISKDDLIERLWANAFVEESNLIQNIYVLRKILGDTLDGKPMIETLRRRGYRFNGKLRENAHRKAVSMNQAANGKAGEILNFRSEPAGQEIGGKAHKTAFSIKKTLSIVLAAVLILIAFAGLGFYLYPPIKGGAPNTRSIAVLPVKPINTANRDEIYEVGIADSLITKLGSMKDFIIRPLNATRKYTDINQDPLVAGKEQKVDYVLASNYQIADGKIRITAQLFNVSSGKIEETYKSEKDAGNIFALQDAIAGEVGNKLLALFATTEGSLLAKRGTTNEEAYRLYLHGTNLTAQRSAADAKKAIEYFEQAIKLDPNFALAFVGMAHAYSASGSLRGGVRDEVYEKAWAAVNKAAELDSNLAEVYAVRAELKLKYEWDFAGVEKDAKTAIELEPNNSLAHQVYAQWLNYHGRFDESLAEIETALEIDPNSLVNQRDRGRYFYFARRYDEAIVQLKRVLEVDANFQTAYHWLWLTYTAKGDDGAAFEWFLKEMKRRNSESGEVFQKSYENGGWKEVLRKSVEFEKLEVANPDSLNYRIARFYSMLDEKDKAFEHLNKSFEMRQTQLVMLKVEPAFDNLRGDARFDELLQRVGYK